MLKREIYHPTLQLPSTLNTCKVKTITKKVKMCKLVLNIAPVLSLFTDETSVEQVTHWVLN